TLRLGRSGNVVGAAQGDRAQAVELLAIGEATIGLDRNFDIKRTGGAFDPAGRADIGVIFAIPAETGGKAALGQATGAAFVGPKEPRLAIAPGFDQGVIRLDDTGGALRAFRRERSLGDG